MIRPADPATVTAALADAAAVGPYFRVGTGPAVGREAGWRPFTDLYDPDGPLRPLVDTTAGSLRTDEPRVAASILFQGIVARLWGPVIAAAAAHGCVPDLAPEKLHWRAVRGGPLPLWLPHPTGWAATELADLTMLVSHTVVEVHLRPFVDATHAMTRVAQGLLWGNAASALAGTVHVLRDGAARGIAAALLNTGPLRGRLTAELMRRSCCLYYRVPGGGLCGDCCLRRYPAS